LAGLCTSCDGGTREEQDVDDVEGGIDKIVEWIMAAMSGPGSAPAVTAG